MGSKVPSFVIVIGASLLMPGCSQDERVLASQKCDSSPCAVPVGQAGLCWPFNRIVVPDKIEVRVESLPVTITWTLDASVPSTTYLNPGKPIAFDHPQYFDCHFDSPPNPSEPRSYTCEDKKDTPKGSYKYSVKTKGLCSPKDLDPTVVNN